MEPTPDGAGRLLLEVILPRSSQFRLGNERWWVPRLGAAALEVYDHLCANGHDPGLVRGTLINIADDMLDTWPPRYLKCFIDSTCETAEVDCVALVDEFRRDLTATAEEALGHRREQAV
ncbi:MAG: hypothetical protein OXI06_08775 [bacterium]|nr:hypothetical protein [bacterium]